MDSRAGPAGAAAPNPRHSEGAYDNPFAPDNAYGHAVELLARHRPGPDRALHIDIGCGYGRIAEPLVARLGLTYVACDMDEDALRSLAARGFETHRLFLADEEEVYQALSRIIAGRPLASISILDTLEHLDEPAATLRALRRIAAEHRSFVLICVPNTTHRDIGLRLLFGQWDYTETGILDYTHRTLFSDAVLRRMLGQSGLHIVDANDVIMAVSDQAFPATHPVVQTGTQLHRALGELRDLGDGFGRTNQLIRLCAAGPVAAGAPYTEREIHQGPLLSVIICSEGRYPDTLAELMTCLAGQSITDFEIIIVGDKLDRPRQVTIEQVIEELPDWLRAKIRFLRVDNGNQAHLLNIGFAAAVGRYITMLDEDDVIFAQWTETFMHATNAAPGQILRSAAVKQGVRRVEFNFATGLRAESGPQTCYPLSFDLVDQLRADASPVATLAFPRGLFHEIDLSFDETLPDGCRWDYLLRTAGLVGVTSVGEITAIVRHWPDAAPDDPDIQSKILAKLDQSAAVLWPAGTTRRFRTMADDLAYLHGRMAELDRVSAEAARLAETEAFVSGLREVMDIYLSTSWRIAAPLRFAARLFGRRPPNPAEVWSLSAPQLQELAAALRRSTSWRLTAPLRLKGRRS